jgi:hypothetical protein
MWWQTRQVRALHLPLFARSVWAQPATVVFARHVMALLWPLFARSPWAQPTIVVAITTGEGAFLASVRLIGVCSASHSGGEHDSLWRCTGFFSLGWRELSQALWWRTRQVRELLLPLIARSVLSQPTIVVWSTTGDDSCLASVHLIGVIPASHCGG